MNDVAARALTECAEAVAAEFGDLRRVGPRRSSEQWFALLGMRSWRRAGILRADARRIAAAGVSLEAGAIERYALLSAVPATVARLASLAVDESVKRHLCVLLQRLPTLARQLDCRAWPFHELAQAVTLRRMVGGQLNWVIGGAGRSPLLRLRIKPAHAMGLVREVVGRYSGFAPVASIHLNPWRDKATLFLRSEACRSLYRIARSMELQPSLKGIQGMSWLHSPALRDVSPHLAWAHDLFADNGAFIAEMEVADDDCGMLTGSDERKRLHESGSFRPRVTLVLWHREDVLAWAARHPEFSESASLSMRVLAATARPGWGSPEPVLATR